MPKIVINDVVYDFGALPNPDQFAEDTIAYSYRGGKLRALWVIVVREDGTHIWTARTFHA